MGILDDIYVLNEYIRMRYIYTQKMAPSDAHWRTVRPAVQLALQLAVQLAVQLAADPQGMTAAYLAIIKV